MLQTEKFNAYFEKNKWNLRFTDKNGRLIHMIAIPPTDGSRIDIITNNKLNAGYNFDTDIFIIEIINGTPTFICTDKGNILKETYQK